MTINRTHLATQKILDLILAECRYWQGRDEARRGGFAILHAAAKEISDQAQAAPEAEPVEVVAWRGKDPDGGEGFVGAKWPDAFGSDCAVDPLMTVAQHERIVAAITVPPAKKGCTKPGCFPYCDCGSIDDTPSAAQPEV